MSRDSAQLGPLALLRRISRALEEPGGLDARLGAVSAVLVPALADSCAIHRDLAEVGRADDPEVGAAGEVLAVGLRARGGLRGELRLARGGDRPGFTDAERILVEEAASRIAAAIDAEERVAAATAMTDEFLAVLSHELRTPLNVVVGWVHMLRSGRLSPERQARALELIERNARLQTRLIEDLLDATRIVSDRIHLELAETAIDEVVRDTVEALRPLADELGVKLVTQLAPATMNADPDRFGQVVQNLVSNALKFTPADGQVEIILARDGDALTLAVTDTGTGIAPDLLPRIFDRFWQGERRRLARSRGLGLGLFITQEMVKLHGGAIAVESSGPGGGARFTVRLPLCGPDRPDSGPAGEQTSSATRPPRS